MNVTIFGSGYVGLVTGACLADTGHNVLCVDVDEAKVKSLTEGQVPIYEPGLAEVIKRCQAAGQINFTADMDRAVAFAEVQFIAVGTPPDEDGSADLRYVLAVAETIGTLMNERKIIVDKSTVPVGTGDKVNAKIAECMAKRNLELDYHVVSNPEFLKEGAAIDDFMKPDRIVVGSDSTYARDRMKDLYSPFSRNHDKMMFMSLRSAELTKYAANAMLATKISFINEMANLAELMGADIEEVRRGIGSDGRIGYQFIYPGCGYGGSCFPKDVQALKHTAESLGFEPKMLSAVEAVNQRQKGKLFELVSGHFNGDLKGRTFAIWGLAFKPNTDDMREAPSRVLMEALWAAGAKVRAYDPEAMTETQRIYGDQDGLELVGTKEAALKDADALIVCTEWKSFWSLDVNLVKEKLQTPAIFDGRNLYDPTVLQSEGIAYYGIGRGYGANL